MRVRRRGDGVRSRGLPKKSGVCTMTQLVSPSIAAAMSSRASGPAASGRSYGRHMRQRRADVDVLRMQSAGDHRRLRRVRRWAISIASPHAVEPSYIDAFATSMPVSAATWVWNSNRTCSVPCAISG